VSAPEGDLLCTCSIPGCETSWWWTHGPPEAGWERSPTFGLLLCARHVWLWGPPPVHKPRLERPSGAGACSCGHPLPGPSTGAMARGWILHVQEEAPPS